MSSISNNTNQISFKINFTNKNEIRRITLENPTWEQFLSFVIESGRLKTQNEDGSRIDELPTVSYKDEDGDVIKVSTQIEFEEALLILADKPIKTFFVASQGSAPLPEAKKEAPRSTSSSSSSSASSPKKVEIDIDLDLLPIMSLAEEFFKSLPQQQQQQPKQETREEPSQQQSQKNEEEQQQQQQQQQQPNRKSQQFKFPIQEILKEVKGAENVLGDLISTFAQNIGKPQGQSNNSNSNCNNNNSRNSQHGLENILGPLGGIFQDFLKQAQRPSSSSSCAAASRAQDDIDAKDKQLYSEQLKTLRELGFSNEELNLAYLRSANGNVERVAASLYEQAAC